jgi:hypothetical protein
MNMKAIDGALERLVEIKYPADKWKQAKDIEDVETIKDEFYLKI